MKTVELVPATHWLGTGNHKEFSHVSNLHVFSATDVKFQRCIDGFELQLSGTKMSHQLQTGKLEVWLGEHFHIFKLTIKFLKVSRAISGIPLAILWWRRAFIFLL